MDNLDFKIIRAIHPHWDGYLRISASDNCVYHEGTTSKGTYIISRGTLVVLWDLYSPDVFEEISGIYVHFKLLANFNVKSINTVAFGGKSLTAKKLSVVVPDTDYEVSLRLNTSDIPTFQQVFLDREYDSPNLPEDCRSIVDLGANVGFATAFFGLRYPNAKILAIEPEPGNYALMLQNTAALGRRVHKEQSAVWIEDGFVNLHTEAEDGSPLGAWGVQVSDKASLSGSMTKCSTLTSLLDRARMPHVDILKIDIEGAELDIFSNGAIDWLPRVDLIIIETHDRFRPGSDDAVRSAIQPLFEELPRLGENLFFKRRERRI